MSEARLRDIVWQHPEHLGYDAGSHRVRSFKWGDAAGTSDVVICPKTGPAIAIVEVKRAVSDETNAMVVGQLLKYYARVLRMGVDGVQDIVGALERKGLAPHDGCSPASLWGCAEQEANDRCRRGRLLGPEDIGLHIVVDEAPPRRLLRLARTCQALQRHHRLRIQLWRLNQRGDGIEPIPGPRTDEIGRAFAGSQRQIQLYLNRHRDDLNRAIGAAVPELRAREERIQWVSPLDGEGCREYRDAEALRKRRVRVPERCSLML